MSNFTLSINDKSMTPAPIEKVMKRIFSEELWLEYVDKVEKDFVIKKYPQFDPYFDFPKNKEKLHKLLSDPSFERMKRHDFIPMVKINTKTPRYRWQEDKAIDSGGKYELETKIRPISFASHFDTYIYGYYAFALNRIYQSYMHANGFQEVVLAYRTDLDGKCNIQFAKEVFDKVRKSFEANGECSAIALDIKGYFDHIDHSVLKSVWCQIIGEEKLPEDQYKVFRSLTKYSYVNYVSFLKHFGINLRKLNRSNSKKYTGKEPHQKPYQSLLDLIPDDIKGPSFAVKMQLLRDRNLVTNNRNRDRTLSSNGIPQGSSMSALLSNIYLANFDKLVHEKSQTEGFVYRRYCDDLLIICDPSNVNEIKDYLIELIKAEYKLTIQDRKTDVIDFKPDTRGQIRSFRRFYNQLNRTFDPLSNEDRNFKNLQYLGFEFNGQKIYIRPGSLSRYFRKMKGRIVKTVAMAYSKNSKASAIFKKQIFERYTHLGKRNFLTYAYNASQKQYTNSKGEVKEGMDSPSIRRQLSAHMRIIKHEIEKTSRQRAKQKGIKKILS